MKDEDGFEVPTLIKECVVIDTDDYNLARPQKAASQTQLRRRRHPFRRCCTTWTNSTKTLRKKTLPTAPSRSARKRWSAVGNQWTAFAAFVPADVKDRDDDAVFEVYLVNDPNFNMRFVLFTHEGAAVTLRHEGEVVGNTKLFLQEVRRDEIGAWERITVQAFAYKPENLPAESTAECWAAHRWLEILPSEHLYALECFTSPFAPLRPGARRQTRAHGLLEAAEVHEAMTDKPKEADRSRQRTLTMSLREGKR